MGYAFQTKGAKLLHDYVLKEFLQKDEAKIINKNDTNTPKSVPLQVEADVLVKSTESSSSASKQIEASKNDTNTPKSVPLQVEADVLVMSTESSSSASKQIEASVSNKNDSTPSASTVSMTASKTLITPCDNPVKETEEVLVEVEAEAVTVYPSKQSVPIVEKENATIIVEAKTVNESKTPEKVKDATKISKESNDGDKGEKPKLVFYINMHLLNKKEVIKKYMAKEVGQTFSALTSTFASKMVSNKTIINEITAELLKEFPKEMEKMGVKATFEQMYTKKTYTVVRVELFEINFDLAVSSQYGGEGVKHYQNILDALEFFEMKSEEINAMMAEEEVNAMKEFPDEIAKELKNEFQKEGLDMNVTCKLDSEEGPYLFDYLKEHVNKK